MCQLFILYERKRIRAKMLLVGSVDPAIVILKNQEKIYPSLLSSLALLKMIWLYYVDPVSPPQKLREKKPSAIRVDDQGFTVVIT